MIRNRYQVYLEGYDGTMRRQAVQGRRGFASVAAARAAAYGALCHSYKRRYAAAQVVDTTGRIVHYCEAESAAAYQYKRRQEYLCQQRGGLSCRVP